MKTQITKKELLANVDVYSVRYCALQTAFAVAEMTPTYYTAGTYGWDADVYDFGVKAIVTGYRPFGKELDCDKVNEVEKYATEIAKLELNGEEKKCFVKTKLIELLNKNK